MYLPEAVQAARGKTLCASISSNPGNHGMNFHNPRFAQLGLNFTYIACYETNVESAIKTMREKNVKGLSIAIPFKESVIPFLDKLDYNAHHVGAVNTVVNENGVLTGYNTDVTGFKAMIIAAELKRYEHVNIHGSGGVARAVLVALEGFKSVEIYSRNEVTRTKLAEKFHRQAFEQHAEDNDCGVNINCTPAGTTKDDRDRLVLSPENVSKYLDLNIVETSTAHIMRAMGIPTWTGEIMAAAQAAEQFRLYTGHKAP